MCIRDRYHDNLAEILNEMSDKQGRDKISMEAIKSWLMALKSKLAQNLGLNEDSAISKNQSTELDKAFVQSGTLGLNLKDTTEDKSKFSTSQLDKNTPLLNESQVRHYFGSNYSSLSVTQKEKMAYSIINQSRVYEAGGNDVKIEDVLNISKAPPNISQQHNQLFMEDKDSESNLFKMLSSAKNSSVNYQQQSQHSFIDSSIRSPIPDEKKKDDTLHISFAENIESGQNDMNVGDLLKDLNGESTLKEAVSSSKVSERSKHTPLEMESLELSAIEQQCELSLDNKNEEKKEGNCKVSYRRIGLSKSFSKENDIEFCTIHKSKSLGSFFNKKIQEKLLRVYEKLKNKRNSFPAIRPRARKLTKIRVIKSSSIKPNHAKESKNKSLNSIYILEKSADSRTPQRFRIDCASLNARVKSFANAKNVRVGIDKRECRSQESPERSIKLLGAKCRVTLPHKETELITPSVKTPSFLEEEIKVEIRPETAAKSREFLEVKAMRRVLPREFVDAKNLRSFKAKVRPVKESGDNSDSSLPKVAIYRRKQLKRIFKS
eukprot:TRINITY_DN6315_c0_g2_i16.p1 TRINITY_DN6315_c0_g2~~TRINITY_DN6315_c0_g2_i16.p1  ORF type:complete len:547 (-),score=151.66 TRINITY_DN6315_c0_g2_i16:119-1759(-)